MRRIILSAVALVVAGSAAFASDLGAPAPAFDWSGFYVGANAGYGAGSPSVGFAPNDPNAYYGSCSGLNSATCPPGASLGLSGGLAGGQIGYNRQLDANWLVGAEADYDWSGAHGTTNSNFLLGSVGPSTFVAKQSIQSFGTVRARVGVIPTATLLIYATGGLAFGTVRDSATLFPTSGGPGSGGDLGGGYGYICTSGEACFAGGSSGVKVGWTLGAGGELAIASNVTLKAEYLYVDLGRAGLDSVALAGGAPAPSSFSGKFDANLNVFRAGLNVKF
ncbi:MAG: outer membrane beta-barrel protein [Roseiarcus sp.]|jgi:outer membrane immunogenic protein